MVSDGGGDLVQYVFDDKLVKGNHVEVTKEDAPAEGVGGPLVDQRPHHRQQVIVVSRQVTVNIIDAENKVPLD